MTLPWRYLGALIGAVAVHAPLLAGTMFIGPQQARAGAKRSELVAILVTAPQETAKAEPLVSPVKPEAHALAATRTQTAIPEAAAAPALPTITPDASPAAPTAPESSPLPSAANVLVAASSAGASTSIVSGHGGALGGSSTGGSLGNGLGAGGPSAGEDARGTGTAARLAGSAEWDCPFPAEADDDDVDHATVTLNLTIDPDGSVSKVTTAADPGHGFGREAKACARSKRWVPGTTSDGRATASSVSVKVRFDR